MIFKLYKILSQGTFNFSGLAGDFKKGPKEIIKKCKYLKNNYFIIYYRENNKNINRYGISVPKKTGKAVIRNEKTKGIRSY